jgi:biopolymer transport protein ExbB/TolQ
MRKVGFWMTAAAALLAATATAETVASGPAQGMTVVPPEERLTLVRVFADAALPVQLVFALLLAAAVAAVAIWALSLRKVGLADAKGLAGALGRLRIVRSGATPLGLLAASYTLFSGFLGMSNVRPAPSITIMAPGWAEAALAVMLGLLATTVAVICERHLEARVRRAAA